MIAIGCLALVVLPLLGLALGGWLAGAPGARWGCAGGLVIALALCGISGMALVSAAKRR